MRHEASRNVKRQSYVPLNSPSYRRKLVRTVRRSPVVVRRAMSRLTRTTATQREDLYVIR